METKVKDLTDSDAGLKTGSNHFQTSRYSAVGMQVQRRISLQFSIILQNAFREEAVSAAYSYCWSSKLLHIGQVWHMGCISITPFMTDSGSLAACGVRKHTRVDY